MTVQDKEMEREATYFAMCLLMPRELVLKEVKEMGGINLVDDGAVIQLAKKFQVPISAMAIRLGQIYGDNKKQ